MSTHPNPTLIHYRVYINAQSAIEVDIDTSQLIYLAAGAMAQQHGLPGPYEEYTFFVGDERQPLFRQFTLAQTYYAQGGDLYLAQNYAPWWEGTPHDPVAMSAVRQGGALPTGVAIMSFLSPRMLALAGIVVLLLFWTVWMLWPRSAASTLGQAAQPTLQAGATLAGQTTEAITTAAAEPTAQATMTPIPATPTPDPAAQASESYQGGQAAYDQQDWELAASQLQPVYDYDPTYMSIVELLSATYYNWGVAARDQGDIVGAQEHFAQALRVAPNHPLAPSEQAKAQAYLAALSARDGGDLREAAIKLEELRDIQSDYLDSTPMLYDIYMAYGAELEGQEKSPNALRIYQKAADLPVEDASAAKGKVKALAPVATPTPKPSPKPSRLRFGVANYNDDPSCISIRITGIGTSGWYFTVDGVGGVVGRFDSAGNARACGLGSGQEVTLTVHYPDGRGVPGGSGVPSRGSAIMVAPWS